MFKIQINDKNWISCVCMCVCVVRKSTLVLSQFGSQSLWSWDRTVHPFSPWSLRFLITSVLRTELTWLFLSLGNQSYHSVGKSSESVQCPMLKACDACADLASYSALYWFGRLSAVYICILWSICILYVYHFPTSAVCCMSYITQNSYWHFITKKEPQRAF